MTEQASPPVTKYLPITPYLMVRGGKAAGEFYARAFGAEELERYDDPDGERLGHVTLRINGAHVYLSDEYPELVDQVGTRSPADLGGTTVTISLTVDDADAWWTRATAAGAQIVRPLADEPYGRSGKLRDPFGHVWSIIGPLKAGARAKGSAPAR